MTNQIKYTAEDFAQARLATKYEAAIACRSKRGFWRSEDGTTHTDVEMAEQGWVPVREATEPAPVTLEALEAAWEQAEPTSEVNLIREGDVVITQYVPGVYSVFRALPDSSNIWSGTRRILQRAPRRPDELTVKELTSAIWGLDLPNDAGAAGRMIAERLAERGSKVVADDE